MRRLDSAFGRLAAAWTPALRRTDLLARLMPDAVGARRDVAAASCVPPLTAQTVLIATQADMAVAPGRSAGAAAAALAHRMAGRRGYQFAAVALCSCAALENPLRQHMPRVLVIDIALLEQADPETVAYLHRRVPGVDWLIAWHTPSSRGFELAVRSRARGCIAWCDSAERVEQALHTLAAGDLWFPRYFMQSLYFSLLGAAQMESPPAGLEHEPTAPPGCGGAPLTERELEVLGLMRQGLTNKQIAERLGVSVNTVKKHLAHTFDKRGLHSRRQVLV